MVFKQQSPFLKLFHQKNYTLKLNNIVEEHQALLTEDIKVTTLPTGYNPKINL